VVACTGLGAGSEHVIRRAASVVSSNGCLEILHVMTPPWYRLCQTEPEAKDRSADDDVRRAACAEQLRMAALIARRMRPRIKVRTRLLAAPRSAPAIVQHAGEHELDLVVVGNRNRSFLSTLLLGSTATKVLRSAGCSVLVVEPEPRLAAAQEEEPAGVSP
jgi:nucleotide-binding universal stress UspA family protein